MGQGFWPNIIKRSGIEQLGCGVWVEVEANTYRVSLGS